MCSTKTRAGAVAVGLQRDSGRSVIQLDRLSCTAKISLIDGVDSSAMRSRMMARDVERTKTSQSSALMMPSGARMPNSANEGAASSTSQLECSASSTTCSVDQL